MRRAGRWPGVQILGWDGIEAIELYSGAGLGGPVLEGYGFTMIEPEYADDDPLCCPSVCFLRTYAWQDGKIVEVASKRQDPCSGR